jgi:hypothetical protein
MARKFFAILAAIIGGGLGIAVMSMMPHAAEAGIRMN